MSGSSACSNTCRIVRAERVFVSRETEDVAHPQVIKLETIIGDVSDWHLLPDRPLPDVPLDPEDDATIFYTSGTTGKPKGAIGTHRFHDRGACRSFAHARTFLRRGERAPAPDPNAPQKRFALCRAVVSHDGMSCGERLVCLPSASNWC